MPVVEGRKRQAETEISGADKKLKLEAEGTEVSDRATAIFTAILNAGTQDEVVEFTNKAATFLHDHSPFKGKPAISKLNAVTRAAVWLGGIMKKSYVLPSKTSKHDIGNLCAWIWDHKLRKMIAKPSPKWLWPNVVSPSTLASFLNPLGGSMVSTATMKQPMLASAVAVTDPAAAAVAAGKKVKAPRKPRKSGEAAPPLRPKRARPAPEPLNTGDLVPLGRVPLSGAKMYQDIFAETPPLAQQMVIRVRQGAEKFQGKPLTGDIPRPAFTFNADKSPARDAPLDSFALKPNGITYLVDGQEKQHEFSPAAIRTLYEKDGTRCGPPQGGTLAQTSIIGNMNKSVEGLTRIMRAVQAPGSRMRPTAAITIAVTSEKADGGGEKPRATNLYLYEGGDPGGKESYHAKFNHSDARAPLLTKGINLPSVNLEVDTSDEPTRVAKASTEQPSVDGLDQVHIRAIVAESVALTSTVLSLEPERANEDEPAVSGVPPSVVRARLAVQRFNQAMIDIGLMTPEGLLP